MWRNGKLSKWIGKGLYTEVKMNKKGEKLYKIRFITQDPELFETALDFLASVKGIKIIR